MPGLITVLPLAFVMVIGPQIICAIFLATSANWRRSSPAYLAGALLTVSFFVTVAYLVVRLLMDAGESDGETSEQIADIAILLLLLYAAVHVFRTRGRTEPPAWMGRLQGATPEFAFTLGLLLLGVFPSDLVTSLSVGSYLARNGDPWWYGISFVLATVLLAALPVLLVLTAGRRAEVFLPKVRDWMNTHAWIVSEIVIVFFIAIVLNGLAGS